MIGAFTLGLLGSLHCLGMCGPLVLLVNKSHKDQNSVWLYHTGRLIAYIALGTLVGLIGFSLQIFKVQQFATIGIGLLLIVSFTIPQVNRYLLKLYNSTGLSVAVRKLFTNSDNKKTRVLGAGLLNGFIPCGLTYVAAGYALVFGTIGNGILYMLMFGLGTLPVLLILTWKSSLIPKKIGNINVIPVIAFLAGSILVMRGLLLSNPILEEQVSTHAGAVITICGF